MNKKIIFLIVFGIFIFGLRLFNINEAIYDDEANFAFSLTVMDQFGFNEHYYSPVPLNLMYKPLVMAFGLETWVFRLIPWLFGMINTLFVFIFARRHFGERAAFWSTFLMLVAFYSTLASLQFDVEGNLIMFCALLMFFSYLEYEKATSPKSKLFWQVLAGVGLGVAVVSKFNVVYIAISLALYSLIQRKWKIKETFHDLFLIYCVGLLFFFGYILLAIAAYPERWMEVTYIFGWKDGFDAAYRPSFFSLLGPSIYVLWSSLLLFGFYILSLVRGMPKWSRGKLLLLLGITVPLLFYTFIINSGSLDRYFMLTIPFLALLGGYSISKINFGRRHLTFFLSSFIFFTLFLFMINSFSVKQLARFPNLYLEELRSFNINFLFAYTSASGPTFGVNFATILWSFFFGGLFLLLYLVFSRQNKGSSNHKSDHNLGRNIREAHSSTYFFASFLAVSLAFNVFLVSEYLFHPTGVDVSGVKWEMVEYVKEKNLSYPIYATDSGLLWYFDHRYWPNRSKPFNPVLGVPDNELGSNTLLVEKSIQQRGGTLLIVHWPPLHPQSPAREIIKLCALTKQFYSGEILIGEIYSCHKWAGNRLTSS